jgi:hypothetical protein
LVNVTVLLVTNQLKVWLPVKVPSEAVTVTLYGVLEAADAGSVPEIRPVHRCQRGHDDRGNG